MNLYNIHPDPKNAPDYELHHDTVPELVWARYKDQPVELKKREKALAKDVDYAYRYALYVLKGPFPAGEAVIAKDAFYARLYARYVLYLPVAEADIWGKHPALEVVKTRHAGAVVV